MLKNTISGSMLLASLVAGSPATSTELILAGETNAIAKARSVLGTMDPGFETPESLHAKVKILQGLLKRATKSGMMDAGPDTEDFSEAKGIPKCK